MYGKLKNRSEFVDLRKSGGKIITKGVVVEYKKQSNTENKFDISAQSNSARLGFTATKKIGSAVYRNKAKRRLKAAINCIKISAPRLLQKNYDINFIARYTTIERPFEKLVKDIIFALNNIK